MSDNNQNNEINAHEVTPAASNELTTATTPRDNEVGRKGMKMTKRTTSNAKQRKISANPQADELPQADSAERLAQVEECLCNVTGIQSPEVARSICSQMARMQVWGTDRQKINMALHMIVELKPANTTEALLAVQMFSVHEAALVFLKRATLKDQDEENCDPNALRGIRLMRLFKEQLEAMMKLKGRATQQKVTVEHVHVHAGAKAVVGVVNPPEGEGERE